MPKFGLVHVLVTVVGLTPELANVVALFVKAKQAKGPGGKKITRAEHDLLAGAIDELKDELKDLVE